MQSHDNESQYRKSQNLEKCLCRENMLISKYVNNLGPELSCFGQKQFAISAGMKALNNWNLSLVPFSGGVLYCPLSSEKDSTKIIFEENLQLVNNDGNVVDEVTISVEPSPLEIGSFEVFQYSVNDGLMLRAWSHVTSTLQTKSEVRKIKQNETAKLLRITSLPDVYRSFMVETDLEQWTGSRSITELPKSESEPFVLEGANVILLRKLALCRPVGGFTAFTVNNDGVFCEAEYSVEYLSHDEVQVTRVVGSEEMTTVLSFHGRILHHRWSNSQWRLESGLPRFRSAAKVATECEQQEQVNEAESMPMGDLPAYWQRKEEVLALLREYVVKHSCISDMMADLMKNLLFEKPDDPIDFADKFLSEFLEISRDDESETE